VGPQEDFKKNGFRIKMPTGNQTTNDGSREISGAAFYF